MICGVLYVDNKRSCKRYRCIKADATKTIKQLEKNMRAHAKALEFEAAADIRDQINHIKESFYCDKWE